MSRLALAILGLFAAYAVALNLQIRAADRRADDADLRATEAEAEASRLSTELAFARVTTRVVTRYIDRVQVVRERGQTIVQEVPVHVTAEADARCPVPRGFVRVHDAAAQGLPLAGSAGDPDAPAPGLALSGVATTVAGNYTTCHEIREQLNALQEWVRDTLQAASQ